MATEWRLGLCLLFKATGWLFYCTCVLDWAGLNGQSTSWQFHLAQQEQWDFSRMSRLEMSALTFDSRCGLSYTTQTFYTQLLKVCCSASRSLQASWTALYPSRMGEQQAVLPEGRDCPQLLIKSKCCVPIASWVETALGLRYGKQL